MKRTLLVITLIAATAVGLSAQGSLSNQVLRLLSRANTWSALQIFDATNGGVVKLERQSAPLGTRTDRLENIGGNLYFNGVVLESSAASGTVTSVDATVPSILTVSGVPFTTSGTIAIDLATESANRIFAGPTTGSPAAPTFRALVDADIPDNLTISCTNCVTWGAVNKSGSSLADLATRSASDLNSGTLPDGRFPATLPIANGSNLTALSATQLASGTVPDGRFPSTLPAVNGSQLTNLAAANVVGTLNATVMPEFTGGDVTSGGFAGSVSLTLGDTAVTPGTYGDASHSVTVAVNSQGRITSISSNAISGGGTVNLATDVTGVLARANGGTGLSTAPTNGQLLIGNGSGYALATITGTTNQVSVTNSAGGITLATPQGIGTTSTPQFARIGLGTGAGGTAVLTTTGQINTGYYANGVSGSTPSINWNNGMVQSITLNAVATVSFTNPISGVAVYRLDLTQDASGSRTVTWPGSIRWQDGAAPTLTTTPAKTDVCTFYWNGTSYLGSCSLNY